MELSLPAVAALVNLLLVAAGLILFLPEGFARPRVREIRRVLGKYAKFIIATAIVLVVHLLAVQVDDHITRQLAWNFAPDFDDVEGAVTSHVPALWFGLMSLVLSTFYIVVHPFMLYFVPLLFVLTDEERPAKAALLAFPLAYALALPFYLFFPVTNVYTFYDLQTPLFEVWPDLRNFYYTLTTVNNAFPSMHVAFALLLANAARYSRNRRFRYFTFAYAALVVVATYYLAIHWGLDILGGVLVALAVGGLTNRVISVERLALQRIKPEPEEAQAIRDATDDLLRIVGEKARDLGMHDVEPVLVGSAAKDTYLRSRVDLDVFVLFPPEVEREELQERGLRIGRAVFPEGVEKYAEHPYIRGFHRGLPADLVPAYKVESAAERKSAVDRTPFHTRFVLEHMEKEQADDVRLLKQFMRGLNVYGAEAKTRGFSGYLCELLVLKFGSFRGVVRAAAKWKPGTFLSLSTVDGNPKFSDPLVFMDPVDPRRNAASAVSAETLALFAEGCRSYLHRESLSYFFPRQLVPLNPDELMRLVKRRRGDFILITLPRPDILEDHLYDQLRKAAQAITNLLERYEFEVRKWTTDVDDEQARILLEVTRLRLPEGMVHTGPPAKVKEHAVRFRKAWEGNVDALGPVYEEKGRLKVKRKREFRRGDELLRAQLTTVDLGKHLNEAARDWFTVRGGTDVVTEETAMLLTRHLTRKRPWEQ